MSENPSPPSMTRTEKLDRRRRGRLLDILAISGIATSGLFLTIMLLTPMGRQVYVAIFAGLLFLHLLAVVLNRVGRLELGGMVFLCSLSLAIFGIVATGIDSNNEIGAVVFFFPYPVLAAGMVLGSRTTFGFATLNTVFIVATGYVAYLARVALVDIVGDLVPAVVLCYLMALVAWLYGSSLEGALHDLTDRGEQLEMANKEIRLFSRTLENKVEERTQELREFVSACAHDLRNPLNVVQGYVELLREKQTDGTDELYPRALHTISTNLEQMVHLTDDLLEVSRLTAGATRFDMQPLAIEDVIADVCANFERRLAEKQLSLELDLAAGLPLVWADSFRLSQVLGNLLGNAYHYTPAGEIVVGARLANGAVEVTVADTGIGIPPEEQKRLFTHFFRGEHELVRSRKGTGLGLTIARSIIEIHGGKIWAESNPGKGSTFHFTLPTATAMTDQRARGATPDSDAEAA
jgi:signal transduction histidine kinase